LADFASGVRRGYDDALTLEFGGTRHADS